MIKNFKQFALSESKLIFFFSILVGVCSGYGAIGFRYLIKFFKFAFFNGGAHALSFLGPAYIVLIPAIGGAIVGSIVYFWAREARGHGVPEVMEAVAVKGGRIRPRVAVVKSLASAICIGSGGSVGREGPIVQIGSALGSTLGQLFKFSTKSIRLLVACGAAGGISATFNAPIAGVFFASEVILGNFEVTSFASIVLSSVTACVISRAYLGNYPAFFVPKYEPLHVAGILLYLLLGVIAALIAQLFVYVLYKTEDIFDALKFPEYIKPILGGAMLGILVYLSGHDGLFGVGYNAIEEALSGKIVFTMLLSLVFLKILATSLTLGSGGSGGVFAPSLFIGAMLGGAYGTLAHNIWPTHTAHIGAYALVGMGALFAGAANAPITAILIVFEMTSDYKIILPLMIACVTSTLLSKYLNKESIYTIKLIRRGVDISKKTREEILEKILVKDAMISPVHTLNKNMKIDDAYVFFEQTKHKGFPVLDEKGELCGIVTFHDIDEALTDKRYDDKICQIATADLIVTYPDENLKEALLKFGLKDIGRLPVVDRNNPKNLLGIITRKSLISVLNKMVLKSKI